MKKIIVVAIMVSLTFVLSGCDFLPEDILDQVKQYTDEYCVDNPDHEVCTLDFEAEFEKAELKFADYFADYSNELYTNQEIADMYFEGELDTEFDTERTADLDNGVTLELVSIDFRLDGNFDISYNALVDGDDPLLRKRPGRIHYDVDSGDARIEWLDGEDNDCDGTECADLLDTTETTTLLEQYFIDYMNSVMTNQEIADKYYAGVLTDEFVVMRDQDLIDGIVFTLVSVLEMNDDDFFEITYETQNGDMDKVVRKRPGRIRYKNSSNVIIWGEDNDCDTTGCE